MAAAVPAPLSVLTLILSPWVKVPSPFFQQDRDRTELSAAYRPRGDGQVEFAVAVEVGAECGSAYAGLVTHIDWRVYGSGREFSPAQPFEEGGLGPGRRPIDRHHVKDAVVIEIASDDRGTATVVVGRGADGKIVLGEF